MLRVVEWRCFEISARFLQTTRARSRGNGLSKHLEKVSSGCGPEGRVCFLVGVELSKVFSSRHLHRASCWCRVGVEAAARDGELAGAKDGPTRLQEHNDDHVKMQGRVQRKGHRVGIRETSIAGSEGGWGRGVTSLAAFEVKELSTTVRNPSCTVTAPPTCEQQTGVNSGSSRHRAALCSCRCMQRAWTHAARVAFEGAADHM